MWGTHRPGRPAADAGIPGRHHTRAAALLIDGIPSRYPSLRMIVTHRGTFLPLAVDRLTLFARAHRHRRGRRDDGLSLDPPICAYCAAPAGHPGCAGHARRTTRYAFACPASQCTRLVPLATAPIGGSRLSRLWLDLAGTPMPRRAEVLIAQH